MIQCTSIRTQVVADLKAAAIVGVLDNVFPSRSRKVWPTEGDVLLVYTQETQADDQDTAPAIYSTQTTVVVQIVATEKEDDTLDNDEQEEELEVRLDTLTEAVVRTLQPVHGIDGPLDGLVDWFKWRGSRPTLSSEGEVLRNSRQVLFSAEWKISLPDDLPEDDFLKMGTKAGAPTGKKAPELDSTTNPATFTDMRTP